MGKLVQEYQSACPESLQPLNHLGIAFEHSGYRQGHAVPCSGTESRRCFTGRVLWNLSLERSTHILGSAEALYGLHESALAPVARHWNQKDHRHGSCVPTQGQ